MRKIALIACLVFILAIVFAVVVSSASGKTPPASAIASSPTYVSAGSTTVDGNCDEWNLPNDFFSDMRRAWKDTKPPESNLYLRYECSSHTLYALVLCEPGVTINPIADENWIKTAGMKSGTVVNGNSGNNGTPPDFQYINNQDGQIIGWEASIHLDPGTYNGFVVHAEVDDGGSQTSGTPNKEIPLIIDCSSTPT